MTILLTGAMGQVGYEVSSRRGARELIALDRAGLDICNTSAVDAAMDRYRPKLVINAAAYTAVDKAESEPERAFAINRDGTAALAAACARLGIPLFHLSTDYVFDGTREAPYPEDAPTAPLGVYGQSKWQGEEAVRNQLPQHLIIRVAWVFGTHGNNFVRTMLRLGAMRPELRVVDDQRGAPTYAGAIADTLLGLADRVLAGEGLPWGTYHYTGEPVTSWYHFANVIFDEALALGSIPTRPQVSPIPSSEYPTPARRPANSALDGSLALERLHLTRQPWIDGLREVLTTWKNVT